MVPLRICHCVWDLERCGAQQVVKQLVTGLDPARYRSVVYAFRSGPLFEDIRSIGIPVRVFEQKIPKFDPFVARAIYRYLKSDRIDILHTHLFGATLHGIVAGSRIRGLHRIVTIHNERAGNVVQKLAYPNLLKKADRIVGVSRRVSNGLVRSYMRLSGRIITIPNGIDTKLFSKKLPKERIKEKLQLPVDRKIIGTIGRLTRQKGHCFLLDAFAEVRRVVPNAHLVMIGEGELLQRLREQSKRLKLDGSVVFLGSRSEIPELLQAMDVFVLSSLWEGLPLVLLEAMASGLPIVATRIGAVSEVVEDEEECLLVAPSDAGALARGITRMLLDVPLARRLSAAASVRVQKDYDVRNVIVQHQNLYELLCTSM
jgi:glycosyltransferase involved in cell wall biosynthesis